MARVRRYAERQYAEKAVDNQETLSRVCRVASDRISAWRQARERTAEAFEFVQGKSWKQETVSALEARGLPWLVINIILPKVLRILGWEQQLRTAMIAIPTMDAGVEDADIATKLLRWCEQVTEADDKFSKIFAHALIGEMGGWGRVDWSTLDDPMGEPSFEWISSLMVLPDPACDDFYNMKKQSSIIVTEWKRAEDIFAEWPEKYEEIKAVVGEPTERNKTWWDRISDTWTAIMGPSQDVDDDFVNTKDGMYRIIEMEERRRKKRLVLYDVYDGQQVEGVYDQDATIMRESDPERYEVVERVIDEIWTITTMADLVLLQEKPNDVQNRKFSVVYCGGYNFGGNNFGMVQQMTGVQKEYQQARSSMLHILHTIAASGWMYWDESLDPDMVERLEKEGAGSGLVLRVRQGMRQPEKIQPPAAPPGEIYRADMAYEDLNRISINEETQGREQNAGQSGILFQAKVQQAMIQLEPLLKNLQRCKRLTAQLFLDILSMKLIPGRVVQIIGEENQVEEVVVDDRVRFLNAQIKLVPGGESPTQRRQRQIEAFEFFSTQPPELRAPHLEIEFMDWPTTMKKKLIDWYRQRLGISAEDDTQAQDILGMLQAARGTQPLQGQPLQLGRGMSTDEMAMRAAMPESPEQELMSAM